MAQWRAEAIKRLPELRKIIASADDVMGLWIEIRMMFENAYKTNPQNDALIGRIYSFADWCMQAPSTPDAAHDPTTAVIVAFYEDIPNFKPARDDMPRWFRYSEVANNRSVFSYHIGDDGFNLLLKHMSTHRHRYQPRSHEE